MRERSAAASGGVPKGRLASALQQAERLLVTNPELSAEQCRSILASNPGQLDAMMLLGAADLRRGRSDRAVSIWKRAAKLYPDHARPLVALGSLARREGTLDQALAMLSRGSVVEPSDGNVWRELADALFDAGRREEASRSYVRHVECSVHNVGLMVAAQALSAGRLPEAEARLTAFLGEHPTDLTALRMLAELQTRCGQFDQAEATLSRCLDRAPNFIPALHNLAVVLHRQMRSEEALQLVDRLDALDGDDLTFRNLRAAILSQLGQYEEAIACYESVLARAPAQSKIWMSYGHLLKTVGRTPESIGAYRRGVALTPTLGEAYWSLANLKKFEFSDQERSSLEKLLRRSDLTDEDRFHIEFTLGKIYEDMADYERSFSFYENGNARRRATLPYDPATTTAHVRRCVEVFDSTIVARGQRQGAQAGDPIFVLGLPRSGSTLIEQILASHTEVEGTIELPDIGHITRDLTRIARQHGQAYPDYVAGLSGSDLLALGDRYLASTAVHRKTDRPFFIDKMPNNWLHVGLILVALPNARIIDARRHPLGCGFSCYKQHFARGQGFSYDLEDIGLYYRDYLIAMDHFSMIAPGRIHLVNYEDMVADPERTISQMLSACNLEFEDACLQFHETKRAVRTASSEQVRQPIYPGATEHWRKFEPWLGPLKRGLGSPLAPAEGS